MAEEFKPQLLDLISSERDWLVDDGGREMKGFGLAEEKKLELRLGLPGEEDSVQSLLSLGYFPKASGAKRGFSGEVERNPEGFAGFLRRHGGKEAVQMAQKTNGGAVAQSRERKPHAAASAAGNAAVACSGLQTRAAKEPVVGWPPIHSFRKNLSNTSKISPESQNGSSMAASKLENKKGLFVKVHMDGIPIGRKVDLTAYNCYKKLSLAVDELFRGLLAAQRDHNVVGAPKSGQVQAITGLLDGSGEYTLVYEDDEGDRMLVGDVPWDMFVSTAKRLRVLKTSEVSASSLSIISRKRAAVEF